MQIRIMTYKAPIKQSFADYARDKPCVKKTLLGDYCRCAKCNPE